MTAFKSLLSKPAPQAEIGADSQETNPEKLTSVDSSSKFLSNDLLTLP